MQKPSHKQNPPTQERTQHIHNTIEKEKNQVKEMDPLANWETMPLIDPSYFENKKPTEGRVFLSKRDKLLPVNEFLDRSAIVLTRPNQNTPTLAYNIVRKLVSFFKINPAHIRVRKIPTYMGDYLAIFPNVDFRNRVCNICAFDLGAGAQIQMAGGLEITAWYQIQPRIRHVSESMNCRWNSETRRHSLNWCQGLGPWKECQTFR